MILRAAMDASGRDSTHSTDSHGTRSVVQWEADRWFRGNGHDFQMICYWAGLDPEHVREAYLSGRLTERVTIDQRWRNGRGAA